MRSQMTVNQGTESERGRKLAAAIAVSESAPSERATKDKGAEADSGWIFERDLCPWTPIEDQWDRAEFEAMLRSIAQKSGNATPSSS